MAKHQNRYPERVVMKDIILEILKSKHPEYIDNTELMKVVETKMTVSKEDQAKGRKFLGYTGMVSKVYAYLHDMHISGVIDVIDIGKEAKSVITDQGLEILDLGGYKKMFDLEKFDLDNPQRIKCANIKSTMALVISVIA